MTEMTEMREIYGDVISVYTRAQAHEDGVLVAIDREEHDGAGLFRHPVSFTSNLLGELKRGAGSDPATLSARIYDVCYMATVATADGSDVFYKCIVGSRTLELWANCGPADDGSPCMTLGFPEDR